MAKHVGFRSSTASRKISVRWRELAPQIEAETLPELVKNLILDGYEENLIVSTPKQYRVNFAKRDTRHIVLFDNSTYVNKLRDAYKNRRDVNLENAGWTVTRVKVNGNIG